MSLKKWQARDRLAMDLDDMNQVQYNEYCRRGRNIKYRMTKTLLLIVMKMENDGWFDY